MAGPHASFVEQLVELFEVAPRVGEVRQPLPRPLVALVGQARANDLVMESEALRHTMPEDAAARVRRDMRSYIDLLTDLVAQLGATGGAGRKSGSARVVAFGIVSMCDRVQTWWRPDGPMTPTQVADEFSTFAAEGLGVRA